MVTNWIGLRITRYPQACLLERGDGGVGCCETGRGTQHKRVNKGGEKRGAGIMEAAVAGGQRADERTTQVRSKRKRFYGGT